MIKNYLKIAIKDELNFDHNYPDADRIYRLFGEYNNNGTAQKGTDWPAPMGKVLKSNFPEVALSGRLMPNSLMGAGSKGVRPADQVINTYEDGITFADQQVLDILILPMV